jgi:hypothetical protein
MTSTHAELAFRPRRAAGLRAWLSVRHPLHVEVAAVVGLYAAYEVARGLVVGDTSEADRHAHRVASIERTLHVFLETDVQRVARALPGLTGLLGGAYLTLHLAVTGAVLLWLHRRRPTVFPFARTALLLASMLALVGFVLYPTAPPRLAGVGIADTISSDRIDINHGLVSALYNPYAAVPSMHIAYALLVACSVLVATRRRLARAAALLYPPAVLFIVVATGNHFFLDAAAGAVIAAVAAAVAVVVTRRTAPVLVVPLAARTPALTDAERRAA